MNNKLPKCFSTIKPNLPVITEHYEIRNPVFHLPAIKHKFAESSLQYCLIKLINEQNCFNEMTDTSSQLCKSAEHEHIDRYITVFPLPIKSDHCNPR